MHAQLFMKALTPPRCRGDLLHALTLLDEEEDINKVLKYFSYEHFYVIYCKVRVNPPSLILMSLQCLFATNWVCGVRWNAFAVGLQPKTLFSMVYNTQLQLFARSSLSTSLLQRGLQLARLCKRKAKLMGT